LNGLAPAAAISWRFRSPTLRYSTSPRRDEAKKRRAAVQSDAAEHASADDLTQIGELIEHEPHERVGRFRRSRTSRHARYCPRVRLHKKDPGQPNRPGPRIVSASSGKSRSETESAEGAVQDTENLIEQVRERARLIEQTR
jgi:hypothetical protein